MAPVGLLVAGLQFANATSFAGAMYRFVADRSLVVLGAEAFVEEEWWKVIFKWSTRADVSAIIAAWLLTYMIIMAIVGCVGFGPIGIVAGSFAAAFQSFMYGGFTPAGGFFAALTSMAMLGTLCVPVAVAAAAIATIVAIIVAIVIWSSGIGA